MTTLLSIEFIPAAAENGPAYVTWKMRWNGQQYGQAALVDGEKDIDGALSRMVENVRMTLEQLEASTPEQRADWNAMARASVGAVQ